MELSRLTHYVARKVEMSVRISLKVCYSCLCHIRRGPCDVVSPRITLTELEPVQGVQERNSRKRYLEEEEEKNKEAMKTDTLKHRSVIGVVLNG
jgi:hypothetical protein